MRSDGGIKVLLSQKIKNEEYSSLIFTQVALLGCTIACLLAVFLGQYIFAKIIYGIILTFIIFLILGISKELKKTAKQIKRLENLEKKLILATANGQNIDILNQTYKKLEIVYKEKSQATDYEHKQELEESAEKLTISLESLL